MARLPHPGGDENTWGDVLNAFLGVAHDSDGSLKTSAVDSAVSDASSTDKGVIQLAGDLGGTSGSPTVPGLASKADQTDLTAHINNTAAAHAASAISITPAGEVTSTDLQTAVEEVDTNKQTKFDPTWLENHPVFRRIQDKYSQSLSVTNFGFASTCNFTVHVVGDSIMEGFGASKYGRRMTALLRNMLAGKRGNYVYYQQASTSTFSLLPAADWPGANGPWTTSGCTGTQFGFGMHGMRIAPSGFAELNFVGSYVNIYYTKTSVSSAANPTVIRMDGTQITTINANNTTTASGFIQPVESVTGDLNAFGAHTLRIECPASGGEFQLEGVSINEGSTIGFGVHQQGTISFFESTHAGFSTTHFLETSIEWDAAFGADLVIMALGHNDVALPSTPDEFKDRMVSLLQRLDDQAANDDTVYLLTLFGSEVMDESWRTALKEAAKEFDPDRAVAVPMHYYMHDWEGFLTGDQADDQDPSHGNDIGQFLAARTLYRLIAKDPETIPHTLSRTTFTYLDVPKYRNGWTESFTINGDTSSTNSTAQYLTYRIWLDPGTYRAVAWFYHNSAGGNASISLNHTSFGTVDTYAASAAATQTVLAGTVTIDAPQWGYVTVRKLGTKNASSSNFGVTFQEVHIRKTA